MFYKIQSIKNWDTIVCSLYLSFILSKNDLIAIQSVHLDFPLSFLFVSMTSFLEMHYQCIFYILNNKFACFYNLWKLFLLFIGLLAICFKKRYFFRITNNALWFFVILFYFLFLLLLFLHFLFFFHILSNNLFFFFTHLDFVFSVLYCW